MGNDTQNTLELRIDALIAYTQTLERRNALLAQELEQSKKQILAHQSQKSTLCEQLMTLAASLEE